MSRLNILVLIAKLVNLIIGILIYGFLIFLAVFDQSNIAGDESSYDLTSNGTALLIIFIIQAVYFSFIIYRSSQTEHKDKHLNRAIIYGFTGNLGFLFYTAELYELNRLKSVELQTSSPAIALVEKEGNRKTFFAASLIIFGTFTIYNLFILDFNKLLSTPSEISDKLFFFIVSLAITIWSFFEVRRSMTSKPNPLSQDVGKVIPWLVLVLFLLVLVGIFWYETATR